MRINPIEIGKRIRSYRLQLHFSQEALAETVHVNTQHISNIEKGKRTPSLDLLVDIASVLHITPNTLLCNSSDDDNSNDLYQIIAGCSAEETAFIIDCIKGLKNLLSIHKVVD